MIDMELLNILIAKNEKILLQPKQLSITPIYDFIQVRVEFYYYDQKYYHDLEEYFNSKNKLVFAINNDLITFDNIIIIQTSISNDSIEIVFLASKYNIYKNMEDI